MRTFVIWVAAIVTIASAAVVPWAYLYMGGHVTLYGYTFDLIQIGVFVAFLVVGLNILAAAVGSGQGGLYWLDFLSSCIACFSYTVVAVIVGIGISEQYRDVTQVLNLPWAMWLLGGLTLFAWVDVMFLQRHKHGTVAAYVAANRAQAPAAPPAPAAPANPPAPAAASWVSPVGLIIALIVVVGLALLYVNRAEFQQASGEKGVTDNRGVCEKVPFVDQNGNKSFILSC